MVLAMKIQPMRMLLGPQHENSIAARGTPLVGWAWWLCITAWLLGISLPIMTVDKIALFTTKYSILSVVSLLVRDQDWFLAFVVFTFTIAAPLYKFDQLWRLWRRYDSSGIQARQALQRLSWISNWSMADVFVVAMIVVIAKTSGFFANAHVGVGLYIFAASAFGSMLLGHWLKSRIQNIQTSHDQ